MRHSWGLIALGTVIVVFETIMLSRGFSKRRMAIGASSFARDEQPRFFWTLAILHLAYIAVGLLSVKVGVGL